MWIEIDPSELEDSEIIEEVFERGLHWDILDSIRPEDMPDQMPEFSTEAMLEDAMRRHRFNHSGGFQTCTDEICDYAYRVLY